MPVTRSPPLHLHRPSMGLTIPLDSTELVRSGRMAYTVHVSGPLQLQPGVEQPVGKGKSLPSIRRVRHLAPSSSMT